MPSHAYRDLKRSLVIDALARQGFADAYVGEAAEIGPGTRRRATLKAAKIDGETRLGFHAAASHAIVDMQECRVLTPILEQLVPGLREMMASLLKDGEKGELYVFEAGNGMDISLHCVRASAALVAWAARWARDLHLARVTAEKEILVELEAPHAQFGLATVHLPPQAFLQPTREGENILQHRVLAAAKGAKRAVELFSGVGTFALPLAERARVHAVDLDGSALSALDRAARTTQGLKPVTTETRDLFRSPLAVGELNEYDVVVLDPPRAGALRQARELARSKISRVVYVSCDCTTFARDARILTAGGYALGTVTPVDQFVWSSHIELVAEFSRV